ncbi:MAG: nucleotidyltransferase family protein [bacterium]|jgi:molybdenum cofactor cytidylyltransferase|nr:nucleotidyltransferase family protein [bacterium]
MSIDGLILAAGCSERAGTFKPSFDLGGKALLIRSIESMRLVCDGIVVVGGCRFPELEALLAALPDIILVRNARYKQGMFSSVQAGLRKITGDAFFLLPGDQPLVKEETLRAMAAADAEIVVPRFRGKKGHPVFFRAGCIPEILALPDKEILRNYIHAKADVRILDVEDPGINLDADTPGDLEKMRDYFLEQAPKKEDLV